MKVQLVSDIQRAEYRHAKLDEPALIVNPAADVLVIAGDIDDGLSGIEAAAKLEIPVLYVLGNHEYYGHGLDEAPRLAKELARPTKNVQVLQDDCVHIDGVRFLGSTLWTDFKCSPLPQAENMHLAASAMTDYRKIKLGSGKVHPEAILQRHLKSLAWLTDTLAEPFPGSSVVITHHAPHPRSVPRRWEDHRLQASYVSRVTGMMAPVDFWFHGHVHGGCDYCVRDCRVVCNPVGGPHEHYYAYSIGQQPVRHRADLLIEV